MKIVTRAEWGAAPPRARTTVNWPAGVDLWVHHTDGPETQTPRSIQAFHMGPSRGWNDIGYGYLVDRDGVVYEGRGEAVAAHSPGKNHEPSVAMIGDYSTVVPSDAMHQAIYDLMDFLNAGDLRGHRENTQTSCPGDAGYRKIVLGPPPKPEVIDPPTLSERLLAHGFGQKSVDQILAALKSGHQGTVPNPRDSVLFRNLRRAGLGVQSARTIVKSLRR